MATWDEASKCPTCGFTGKSMSQKPAPDGNGVVHMVYCTNDGCQDQTIPWQVQQRADGSIPDPTDHTGHVGIDPAMVNPQLAQQIRDALEMQRVMSMIPNNGQAPEIRR